MKPILFNTEMVQAILEGKKTVTRRVIKPQPQSKLAYICMGYNCGKWGYPAKDAHKYWDNQSYAVLDEMSEEEYQKKWTPPCHTGDILYVRETWRVIEAGYPPRYCKIEYATGETVAFDEIIATPTRNAQEVEKVCPKSQQRRNDP